MASAAEQLASNLNWGSIGKATELKKRLWFTVGALLVFRVGAYIPVPGVDPAALAEMFAQNAGGIAGMLDVFSGGAIGRMSILALSIMPYISASIIMQILTTVVPSLEALKKEGEAGRKKINQYTRYGTVLLAAFQAYGIAVGLESQTASMGPVVHDPGLFFRFVTIVTLVGGTLLLMWLGEQITARGVGNGTSLIIFAGIVAALPSALVQTLELGRTGALSALFIIALAVGVIAVVAVVVFVETAQRRIVVQYPKRQVGNRMYGGEASHLPLKINTSGVIPPIFASSLLLFPATIASFQGNTGEPGVMQWIATYLAHGQPLYLLTYIALIVFFCFFYTTVVFNPTDTADNLKKNGGFVPGIRPGKNTAEYLEYILNRLTMVGAIYLSAVCILPELLIARGGVPFY
ncbi:MAG TPA: preprotein translocase subunit SecY, partial [Reyranella sp.]|nr:preprotein translocase subunit SecY [Reyranella sp.]